MNILWNIHLYPPSHNCGSEYVAHNINKFMISRGHSVHVILQRYDGDVYNYEGVDVFPKTGNLDVYRWADVILTHLDFTQDSIIKSLDVKKPVIHFVHNDITYESINSSVRGCYVVYNSNWVKKKVNYKWPSFVLHPPCDIDYYKVCDRPENNEYITLISLNERKGGYLFSKIAKAMPGRKFIGVIGSYDNPGPMKLTQGRIIDMMPENVEIIPNSPDILSVYKRTRLLLMPSDYESWGRTATESMINGIPVICTPTDGLQENCNNAAVYVGRKIKGEPGGAQVDIGSVDRWVSAIEEFDDENYYKKYSLLCKRNASKIDNKLDALESFLSAARF